MSWQRFFRRKYWDQERARELQAHLEVETAENVARGMSPKEARYAAQRKLGNTTRIREEIYRMNSLGFLETLWQDLRYGVRLLRLNPGFAVVAILSLALGIGANTAIFQLIDAVRLRTLPVQNPQELAEVHIADWKGARGQFSGWSAEFTNPLWESIRDHQQVFSSVFAWGPEDFNLSTGGEARRARGLWVSGDFFRTLGVSPLLGRLLTAGDDRRGCGAAGVVISYPFWQREFGGNPAAVSGKLTLEGHPFPILGVTPASFYGVEVGRRFDVAVPICSEPVLHAQSQLDGGTNWWLAIMGRRKSGESLQQASAQLRAVSPGIFQSTLPENYPAVSVKDYLAFRLQATSGDTGISQVREQYSDPLWVLLGLAGLVLLIACANLANLMLARASARQREIAVRLALGASRWRLLRQLLAESLLLAGVGAAFGTWLASSLSRVLVSLVSTEGDPWFVDLQLDWRMLAFTAGLAGVTCLLFGLAPALRASHTSPGMVMKANSRGMTASRERFGLRRALVMTQIALSLVLVVGALLFARSLRNLLNVDAGFQPGGILITGMDFQQLKLPVERIVPFRRELLERIRAIPGVESAAEANIVPLGGMGWSNSTWMDGGDSRRHKNTNFSRVSSGYFKTMATPLLAGRDFDQRDTASSPKVAIVNQAFARQIAGDENPVGKSFRVEATPYTPETIFQIVGLVRNSKYYDLREDFRPIGFQPAAQDPRPGPSDQIVIRSTLPPASLEAEVKRALAEVNPGIVVDFQVFKTQIRDTLLQDRLMSTLSGFFGLLAALLATIGLYCVVSYMVSRRTNEIGIRMALGADRGDILGLVLGEASTLVGIGVVAGSVLAIAVARTARAMLFGLQPSDPVTLLMAVAGLATVAAAASYLPARRAARLDPMVALRDE